MRKKIVAGNWKMNNDLLQTTSLITALKKETQRSNAEVMIAPAFTNLQNAYEVLKDHTIEVIAQNMHFASHGAYTGEISATMLKSIGINTVILGHSERRAYFNETDKLLAQKVNTALNNAMRIIFCFGEELLDRQNKTHNTIVKNQIKNVLFHLPESSWNHIVLAYEPVWAIGTGETATAEQVQQMHATIRRIIEEKYNETLANSVSILYGGSVKPSNAKDIFSKPDVDGGLIGGAALNASQFFEIVNAL